MTVVLGDSLVDNALEEEGLECCGCGGGCNEGEENGELARVGAPKADYPASFGVWRCVMVVQACKY